MNIPMIDVRNPRAVRGAATALLEQYGFCEAEPGNEYRGFSVLEIVDRWARDAGVSAEHRNSPNKLATLARSDKTDALPLLGSVFEQAMIAGYEAGPRTWRHWTRQVPRPNFRPVDERHVLGFDFASVPEAEGLRVQNMPGFYADTATADTKAVIAQLSRQKIVDGDFDIFRLGFSMGWSAARAVAKAVYGLLAANPTTRDGGQLFNATAVTTAGGHANVSASAGAPDAARLQEAKAAIRGQAGRPGGSALGLRPRYLLSPTAIEETAWAALASPYGLGEPGSGHERGLLDAGRLQLIVDPELDAGSTTAWYVVADPVDAPLIEIAFLGTSGMRPYLRDLRANFDTDGVDFVCMFDFGVGAAAWRGGFKNAGA
jgi:hypothetical protein